MDTDRAAESREALRMGDITQATGVSDQAVRHYERLGLVRSVGRTTGGFRLFEPGAIPRIRLIKDLQQFGFSLEEIRILIHPVRKEDPACQAARALITRKSGELAHQIERIRLVMDLLQALQETCVRCGGPCSLEECLTERLVPFLSQLQN